MSPNHSRNEELRRRWGAMARTCRWCGDVYPAAFAWQGDRCCSHICAWDEDQHRIREERRARDREAMGSSGQQGPLSYPPRPADSVPGSAGLQTGNTPQSQAQAQTQTQAQIQSQGSNLSPFFNAFRSGPGKIGSAPSQVAGQSTLLAGSGSGSGSLSGGLQLPGQSTQTQDHSQGPSYGTGHRPFAVGALVNQLQQAAGGYTQTGAGQTTAGTGYVTPSQHATGASQGPPILNPPEGEECTTPWCEDSQVPAADGLSSGDTEPMTDLTDLDAESEGKVCLTLCPCGD